MRGCLLALAASCYSSAAVAPPVVRPVGPDRSVSPIIIARATADSDDDRILDVDDLCPDEPEDIDGFEDRDGCPDPDVDIDPVVDLGD